MEATLTSFRCTRKLRPAMLAGGVAVMLWAAGCGNQTVVKPDLSEPEPPSELPTAGEVVLYHSDYDSRHHFNLDFPNAMVAREELEEERAGSPLKFDPPVETATIWYSDRNGNVSLKSPLKPSTRYRVTLDPGLKDLDGAAVNPEGWFYEFSTPPFRVAGFGLAPYYTVQSLESVISPEPLVSINFTTPVEPEELARTASFRDVESGKEIPANVVLTPSQKQGAFFSFYLTPERPLPMGRAYQVVLRGTCNAVTGTPLPYPAILPLGKTSHLGVEWVAAINQPFSSPHIHVKFTERLDPKGVDLNQLKLDPPVEKLKITTSSDDLFIYGEFDTTRRYKLTLNPGILGERGVNMDKPEVWGATFEAMRPTVAFPQESRLYQAAVQGMDMSFVQINTGKLKWRLAELPFGKINTVASQLRKYEDPKLASQRVRNLNLAGPVVDIHNLKVVAEGEVPASGDDRETLRRAQWRPEGANPGLYVFEVTGSGSKGRSVGNRVIVNLMKYALVRKDYLHQHLYRIFDLTTGRPVPGLPVTLRDRNLKEIASGTTKPDGSITFNRGQFGRAHAEYVTLGAGEAAVTQQLTLQGGSSNRVRTPKPKAVTALFSDQKLYRPGHTIKFKGITRVMKGSELSMPAFTSTEWFVKQGGREVARGEAKVSPQGGWSGEWGVPEDMPLGGVEISGAGGSIWVQVEEFKQPLFSVSAEAESSSDNVARANVRSAYFHGAPNVGAQVRWKAHWSPVTYEHGYNLNDEHSEQSLNRGFSWNALGQFPKAYHDHNLLENELYETITVEGTATLDAEGEAKVECANPFKNRVLSNRMSVYWTFVIVAPDGDRLGDGASATVQSHPVVPGIQLESDRGKQLSLSVGGFSIPDPEGKDPWQAETKVGVTVYRVDAKVAREEISPHVYRYRNTLVFNQVWQKEVTTPESFDIPVEHAGRYVAVAKPLNGGVAVSDDADIYEPADQRTSRPAQHARNSSISVNLATDKKSYQVGDTVRLNFKTGYTGRAWVTVESDRILDQFDLTLNNNAAFLEFPAKLEYAPNVKVTAYVLKPGSQNRLPLEDVDSTSFRVYEPGKRLGVSVALQPPGVKPGMGVNYLENTASNPPEFRPGDSITGVATIESLDKPVPGAEVTLFAVDESALQYGGWKLPDFMKLFYPTRDTPVSTHIGLSRLIDTLGTGSLTQKGWLVGDKGGDDFFGDTRKDFRTLAFWSAEAIADAKGQVSFNFEVPDSLTSFRIVAVAHSKAHQFGSGKGMVRVNKPLQAEPALPRFVRAGDEIELRAVVRQTEKESATVRVSCRVQDGLELLGEPTVKVTAKKNQPVVVQFRARAGENVGESDVSFAAIEEGGDGFEDRVQVKLPILPPTILLRRAVSGEVSEEGLKLAQATPAAWLDGTGTGEIVLSSSPYLPQLAGLPEVLEYPYGCMEQISSRILAYTMLRDLLNELPVEEATMQGYEEMVRVGFKKYEESQLSSGAFAYWPGTSSPNLFATVQATWSMLSGREAGMTVDESVLNRALDACEKIVKRESNWSAGPYTRAFALMVIAQSGRDFPATPEARELYLHRDQLSNAARAMLALACHRYGILEDVQKQLLLEIKPDARKEDFDPQNFGSATRTEAMVYLARLKIEGAGWDVDRFRAELEKITGQMTSASQLSTQENLWLLLAFHAAMRSEPPARIGQGNLPSPPDAVSTSGSAIAWTNVPLDAWKQRFKDVLDPAHVASYFLRATYRGPLEQPAEKHGIFVNRTLTNLTDASRKGTAASPLRIGDEVLITYSINSEDKQYYVALDDQLPACLEAINPAISAESMAYQLPDGVHNTLYLSNVECRDASATLFFDRLPKSAQTYSILARVKAGGEFRWPGTQLSPMYDARFSGVSASSQLHADGQFK